jgi:nicotinate-nucleotide adenylyltransferase
MARAATDHLKLDRLIFMPTGAPRYRTPAVASGTDRLAMLRLAFGEADSFEVDARELAPGASGYTVDTLRELGSWHRPEDVRKLARIAVFARPGVLLEKSIELVPMPPMPLSASEVRARVARGEDISGMVPAAVAQYIAEKGLYR